MVTKSSDESSKDSTRNPSYESAQESNMRTATSSKENELVLDKRESSERRSTFRGDVESSPRNERSFSISENNNAIKKSKSVIVDAESQPRLEKSSASYKENDVPTAPPKSSSGDLGSQPHNERSITLNNGKYNASETSKTHSVSKKPTADKVAENNIEERRQSGSIKRLTITSFPIVEVPPGQEAVSKCRCMGSVKDKPVEKPEEKKRRKCPFKGNCSTVLLCVVHQKYVTLPAYCAINNTLYLPSM